MGKIVKHLNLDPKREGKALRMAALLHDIGQYPLSHTGESVYRKLLKPPPEGTKSLLQWAAEEPLDDTDKAKDKWMAQKVLDKCEDINKVLREALEDSGYSVEDICKIIRGEYKKQPLFDQLMSSDFDVDRLDYIPRDTHGTGVEYGSIELDYLIEKMTWLCHPLDLGQPDGQHRKILVLPKGRGRHPLEHYLLSRYFMYAQIVYHRDIVGLEHV